MNLVCTRQKKDKGTDDYFKIFLYLFFFFAYCDVGSAKLRLKTKDERSERDKAFVWREIISGSGLTLSLAWCSRQHGRGSAPGRLTKSLLWSCGTRCPGNCTGTSFLRPVIGARYPLSGSLDTWEHRKDWSACRLVHKITKDDCWVRLTCLPLRPSQINTKPHFYHQASKCAWIHSIHF